jgi:thiosulfate/3-mercaptopyruvate sulfurtransferase
MIRRLVFLFLAAFLVACQTGPTRVYETKTSREKTSQALIDEKTVLIDARPPFQFSTAHPNGAINLQWQDFTQQEPPFEGYLEKDLFFHARRLARLGIGPETDVLILGRGPSGEGEEGRLAWTLRRMGLKRVRFLSLEALDWPWTKEEAPPRAEVPIWKPQVDESLEISRKDAVALIKKPKGEVWVLDVRPEADYLRDADVFTHLKLRPRLINVPWTDFLDVKGALNSKVKDRLVSVGIHPQDRLLVIDERGVRSAGTTLLLRDLGYSQATHWTGGYRELRWGMRFR